MLPFSATMFNLVLLLVSCSFSSGIIVKTPYGKIEGISYTTPQGFKTDVFLGLRYAQAPIGDLRYEKPLFVKAWSGVFNATTLGKACHVHHKKFIGFTRKTQSEDCLNMNMVVPSKKSVEKFSTVVFLHGGGFVLGDAEAANYKTVAETFVSKNIIFVSIQYRLGFLGTKEMLGNLGLWDQTLALRFLHHILPSFGGDVHKITVMGTSAGSASITHLMASPQSFGLFAQGIQMSGSGFTSFAYGQNVVKESATLAAAVGCTGPSVKKCMQGKSVDELQNGMNTLGFSRKHSAVFQFQPRFDGDFFPEEIDTLLAKAPRKPTIQGLANQESFLLTLKLEIGPNYIRPEKRNTFGKQDFINFLNNTFTEEEFGEKDAEVLTNLTMEFYADSSNHGNASFYIKRFTDLSSDFMFIVPVYEEIKVKEAKGWETYSYVIDYVSEATKDPTGLITGVFHGAENRFILDAGQNPIPLSENDKRFQKYFVGSFVNFVKTGTPSTKDLQWFPITSKTPDRFMRLNANPYMENTFFRKEAADFWLKTLPKAVGSTQIRKLLPAFHI